MGCLAGEPALVGAGCVVVELLITVPLTYAPPLIVMRWVQSADPPSATTARSSQHRRAQPRTVPNNKCQSEKTRGRTSSGCCKPRSRRPPRPTHGRATSTKRTRRSILLLPTPCLLQPMSAVRRLASSGTLILLRLLRPTALPTFSLVPEPPRPRLCARSRGTFGCCISDLRSWRQKKHRFNKIGSSNSKDSKNNSNISKLIGDPRTNPNSSRVRPHHRLRSGRGAGASPRSKSGSSRNFWPSAVTSAATTTATVTTPGPPVPCHSLRRPRSGTKRRRSSRRPRRHHQRRRRHDDQHL